MSEWFHLFTQLKQFMLKDIRELILDFADNSQWLRRLCGIAIRAGFLDFSEGGPMENVLYYSEVLNRLEMDWNVSSTTHVNHLVLMTQMFFGPRVHLRVTLLDAHMDT